MQGNIAPSLWSLERDKMSGNQDLIWQNACHHSGLWRGIKRVGEEGISNAKMHAEEYCTITLVSGEG
jgi:hypothetical protein